MDPVYRPVIGVARAVFLFQGLRFRITGTEHIPRQGGAVLAINHTGYFDFTYAGLAARPAGRLVRFMAKEVVFRHRVSGPLMRGMKHIPVDRAAGAAAFAEAVNALRRGEIVGVFPEATLSRSFEIKSFKSGAARMAADADVPIIPVVIWGSQRVWTKGLPKRLGRSRIPIFIEVGEPLDVAAGVDAETVTTMLRDRMIAMLERLRTEYEAAHPSEPDRLPARLGGLAPTADEAAVMEEAEALARMREHARRRAHEQWQARDPQTGD